jgi:hydrophobe/amphiphile efflux-1 (HAE1) family protein
MAYRYSYFDPQNTCVYTQAWLSKRAFYAVFERRNATIGVPRHTMNISAWAIRRPTPIILLFVVLMLLGIFGYRGLGANEWPDVDFPTIVVEVQRAGAAPAELETEVTRHVEDALVGINGLEHIRSTVTDGMSATVAEFKIGTASQAALSEVRDAVARIRQNLPADIQEPSILHPNISGEPFTTYTIASDKRDVAELSRLVDNVVTRELYAVEGVAQVKRLGGLTREIRVELDPVRLRAVGATVEGISAQLKGLNVNVPGGRAMLGGQEQGIRTIGSAPSAEALRARAIALGSGRSVRLDTLGMVSDTFGEVRQIARLNGQRVVAFAVSRAQGSPIVQTEEAVRKRVDELQAKLPPDVRLTLVRTQADGTRASVAASLDALIFGAVLAVAVVYSFLRSFPSTVIAGLAIPLSVFPTFFVMKYLGYSLNLMTLIGLTLIVGILVDDAIVDLENIHRHIQMGKSPLRAALEATDEIGLAIIATTLTIVAVFIPVAFMPGIPGMFFRSFGLTVAVAVLFSLLVARTLTPLLAAYWLRPHAQEHIETEPAYQKAYLRWLAVALRHRAVTLGLAGVIFAGSLTLVPYLPKGLMGSDENAEVEVTIQLPTGSSLSDTDQAVREMTRRLMARDDVKNVFATIGGLSTSEAWFGNTGATVSYAKATVVLKGAPVRKLGVKEWVTEVSPQMADIPGARIAMIAKGATGAGKPVSLILRGTDHLALEQASDRLLAEMRQLPELRDVTSSLSELKPELQIVPRGEAAAMHGLTVAQIGQTARLATQGDVDFQLAKFNAGDRQINIRVSLPESQRADLATLNNLMLSGAHGLVPLRSVADIRMGFGPVQINRYDRVRQVTLSANLNGDTALGDALARVQKCSALSQLPEGVTQDTLGDSEIINDVFYGFGVSIGFGILLIYVVLILLFGGFMQPLTIMMALPLSIGGALAGLLLADKEMGMMALIGILMLMGLVTKNSILLVEYTQMARREGLSRAEAILRSGRDRLRPILMTTIAMIAGMFPIALSWGKGTEILSPMAVAVIGGLTTSTLLTLLVVPVTYTVVDDLQQWALGVWQKRHRHQKDAPRGRDIVAPL